MIPEEVVSRSLDRIYNRGIDVEREIDPDLFKSTWELLNVATDKGFGQRSVDSTDYGFYKELQYNNGVYAAYRVHRCQNDLATAMIGEDKQLKPFDKWTGDVQPMLNHNVGSWLKTEYDTAVIRAHQADDWRRFEADKDLFPRLEWLPTTSSAPDTVHQAFWGTILPVDHPFWSAHRPGDRWNCKCTLRNTDKAATDVPVVTRDNKPDPGLDCNPGISGKIFADSNPHQKHAYEGADKAVKKCMSKYAVPTSDGFKVYKEFSRGGKLMVHANVEIDKQDYKDLITIGRILAQCGRLVKLTPSVHHKSKEYQEIYKSLIGTIYERKCPDLMVDGVFYEYEGFIKPWSKRKISNMIKHGSAQSSHIIINNTKGCSHRYIKRNIESRLRDKNFKSEIKHVMTYESGNLIEVYKKTEEDQ